MQLSRNLTSTICALNILLISTFAIPSALATTPATQALTIDGLGDAQSFNAFFYQDFTSKYSDSHGKIAAGGNVSLDGYGVASRLPSQPEVPTLIVGGDLSYSQGEVFAGGVLVGGSTNNVNQFIETSLENGASIQGNAILPINFQEQFAQFSALSTSLAQVPTDTVVEYRYGGIYLTGDCTSDIQVFNLNGETVLNSNHLVLNCVPSTSNIIFNIDGQTAGFRNIGLGQLNSQASNILYNFYQAKTVKFTYVGIEGSVLAPNAHFDNPRGQINGTVIGKSWDGTMELHDVKFTGSLPVDPVDPVDPTEEEEVGPTEEEGANPFEEDVNPFEEDVNPFEEDVNPFEEDANPFEEDANPFEEDEIG